MEKPQSPILNKSNVEELNQEKIQSHKKIKNKKTQIKKWGWKSKQKIN